MSNKNIVRAWKDEEYRKSLSGSEQSLLPANPAGMTGLTEEELAEVTGAISVSALRPTGSMKCTKGPCSKAYCRG